MKRLATLLILILIFQSKDALCGFDLRVTGVAIKRLVAHDDVILATDGKKLLLINEQGDRLISSQLNLDNSYLLQSALFNQGHYYLLYQHTNGISDFTVVALDESLTAVWQKGFSHQGSTFGYAMCERTSGGVVVAGRSCVSGFFLYAIDQNGNESWKRLYAAGDVTALPGAIVNIGSGYVVAYKSNTNGVAKLKMMQCAVSGVVSQSSSVLMSSGFYIKSMTSSPEGYSVLLHRPEVSLNSIIEFTNTLTAINRFDIASSTAVQLNGMTRENETYHVTGNILQTGTNLDMLYARINVGTQQVEGISMGNAIGYDDGNSIISLNGKTWYSGSISGNGTVVSIGNIQDLCSVENVSLSIQVNDCSSTASVLSGLSMSEFEVVATNPFATSVTIGLNIICSIDDVTPVNELVESEDTQFYNIYPNPASTEFYIDLVGMKHAELLIFNLAGQIILTQPIHQGVNKISVSHLHSGTYVTTISNNTLAVTQTGKLVLLP